MLQVPAAAIVVAVTEDASDNAGAEPLLTSMCSNVFMTSEGKTPFFSHKCRTFIILS